MKFGMYLRVCMYVDYKRTYELCMKYCLEVKSYKIHLGDETLRL